MISAIHRPSRRCKMAGVLGNFAWRRAALVAALSYGLLAPSRADAAEPGFAVDRFEPSERGSRWFSLESLDLRGHARPAFGAVASYQYRPLVVRTGDEVRAAIVNHVLTTHLGGAVNLWDRVRFALNLPLARLKTRRLRGASRRDCRNSL